MVQFHENSPEKSGIDDMSIVNDMAVIIEDGLIADIQQSSVVRSEYDYVGHDPELRGDLHFISLGGKAVIPGLVDGHTHLVWSGDRSREVRWRQQGKSYSEIASMGGGIASTTAATRAASTDSLFRSGYQRMRRALRSGTTHMEVKSGYGLSTESELKLLEVSRQLGSVDHLPSIDSTWLGAHDIPSGMTSKEYLDVLISEQLPAVVDQGIARSADVFCEPGWFSIEESEDVLKASRNHGLSLRMHIDEFQDGGGGDLAAELRVDTADHAHHTSWDTRLRMNEAGVLTGFLPGTPYAMGELWPDLKTIEAEGLAYSLATDFNPNCQTLSLPFMGSLMVQRCGLDPLAALKAVTWHPAQKTPHPSGNPHGNIEVGAVANLNVLESPHWESWCLQPSHSPFHSTFLNGHHTMH